MASSRLEKIGTIYTRTRGLIQSGALKWADRPLWFDIYEAFPPKEEPRFDRPKPNLALKSIFYEEDKIRAMFQNKNKAVGTINLFNEKSRTLTQRLVEVYKTIAGKYDEGTSPDTIYEEAVDFLKRERAHKKETSLEDEEFVSIAKAFQDAQISKAQGTKPTEANLNISVKDIFKE